MIYTVLGEINKETLGVTMSHEHFKWEFEEEFGYEMYYKKLYKDEENKKYHDSIMPVLSYLKGLGVQAVVETSPPIGGQNLRLLHSLSKESGIHIIPCTGWNMSKHVYDVFASSFVEHLSKRWINDFEQGLDTIDENVIRPSYIKIILDEGSLSPVDKAMLEAAIIASKTTGLGIHCHIIESEHVLPVMDLLIENNMDMERFLWAHSDLEGNKEVILKVLKLGAYIGIDNIKVIDFEKCYELLNWVIDEGYEKHVLLSEDLDFYEQQMGKNELECGRLFSDFIPHCIMMGISKEKIQSILTNNPSNFYNVK